MSRGSKPTVAGLVIGGIPRADLLPPEIKAGERARAQRRGLIALLILVVILVGGGYAGGSVLAQSAQAGLDNSNAQTAAVLVEQTKYVEVSAAQKSVVAVEAARSTAMATEIDWKTQLAAIMRTLPSGATVTSLTVNSTTPLEPLAISSSPLEGDRVAELVLTVSTKDAADTAKWVRDLSSLPGFVDATPTAITAGDGFVSTVLTLHLNSAVYWNRFATEVAK